MPCGATLLNPGLKTWLRGTRRCGPTHLQAWARVTRSQYRRFGTVKGTVRLTSELGSGLFLWVRAARAEVRMRERLGRGIFLPSALLASGAAAQGLVIEHQGVGCVVADEFPKLEARLQPVDKVAKARVHFRRDGDPYWYSVSMKAEGGTFSGVLPKPKKTLRSFRYYIEAADASHASSRTPEFTPTVVAGPAACRGGAVAAAVGSASLTLEAPEAASPVPGGFASAGITGISGGVSLRAVVVGVTAAGAAATGIVLATGGSVDVTGRWIGRQAYTNAVISCDFQDDLAADLRETGGLITGTIQITGTANSCRLPVGGTSGLFVTGSLDRSSVTFAFTAQNGRAEYTGTLTDRTMRGCAERYEPRT